MQRQHATLWSPEAGSETFSKEPFLSCAACFGRDISRAARPRRMSALADLRAFMRRYRLNSTPVERRRGPFARVAELVDARDLGCLGELKDKVQLRGLRPGKVPMEHLRKIYGKAVMAETIEALIRELNAKVVTDHGLKLAMEPKVTIPNEETEVAKVIGGQSDLAYT